MGLNTWHNQAFLALFIAFHLHTALAASGGRMGGESFSSTPSSSSPDHVYPYDRHLYTNGYDPNLRCSSLDCKRNYLQDVEIGHGKGSGWSGVCIVVGMIGAFFGMVYFNTERKCVIKLQVALRAKGQTLHKCLNDIARTADTSNLTGLHYILTETTLALLQHPDFYNSAYSCVDVNWKTEAAEKCFNKLSIEERKKFDTEAIVNFNNVKIQRTCVETEIKPTNGYLVVTILVVAQGSHKIPGIKNVDNLKEALQYLLSIPKQKTLAVEVLWTPHGDETLSEIELLDNYPLLKAITS